MELELELVSYFCFLFQCLKHALNPEIYREDSVYVWPKEILTDGIGNLKIHLKFSPHQAFMIKVLATVEWVLHNFSPKRLIR